MSRVYDRCVLSVSSGVEYAKQGIVMAKSFLAHNDGWDAVCLSNVDVARFPWWIECRPLDSLFDGKKPLQRLSPFDKCEVGRFIAIARLLDEYEEVLYCDNDIHWYGEYKHDNNDADVLLAPHFCNPDVAMANREMLFRDGCPNIGIMHWRGRKCQRVLELIAGMVEKNPASNRHGANLWLQSICTLIPWLGLRFGLISDIGCNVASWNLRKGDRTMHHENGEMLVNCDGKTAPLTSFHFSRKSIGRVLNGMYGDEVKRLAEEHLRDVDNVDGM